MRPLSIPFCYGTWTVFDGVLGRTCLYGRLIDFVCSDLEGILRVLEALTKPNLAEKVFKHKGHSEELLQCKETLDHSFKRFQVGHARLGRYLSIDVDSIRFTAPLHYDLICTT